MQERLENFLKKLNEQSIDSAFITSKANVYYLSNYYTDPHERIVGIYLSEKFDPIFLLPKMEESDARNAGWKYTILSYYDHENPWNLLKDYLNKQNHQPQSVALEQDHITMERYQAIQNTLPGSQFLDAKELLANLRVIKSEKELSLLKTAAELADFGIQTGVETIQEGVSELDLVATIEYSLKKQGIREMSFQTMALSGAKTASPHGNPSTSQLEKNGFVLFDLGVIYQGYCSDITRTVAFGNLTEEQKSIYETVLKAEEAAIERSTIGTSVGTIDQTARKIISDAGFGEYFTHRIGHGLGIETHEYPSMHGENKLPLQSGMTFTIEPGIYVPNVGGVRIEDMIYMTEEGPKTLTKYPKNLQIVN
ncbi:M24 family metallopeptidase [Oceanobacillus sp. 1P07AA]|uniref:M24 family metallopeptidase n=1 Tax=Oceanobacillus sp. 1P07AA TaxID=3132293 RepID=UPI0039A62881